MKRIGSSKVTLVLGFFDGIHAGHRKVLGSAVEYAKVNNSKTVLLTFPCSPAAYFCGSAEYIYPRNYNYHIIKRLGIDEISETDFRELADISAEDYLEKTVNKYKPVAVFTGFNYTFGKNRVGNPEFLEAYSKKYNYKYFCVDSVKVNNVCVSSTLIKELLKKGEIEQVNNLLKDYYTVQGKVIRGNNLGRQIGFPTANIEYPPELIQLPYGVYKTETFDLPSITNWGVKPTFNGNIPIMETHIPNYNKDLYEEKIEIKFIKKIRDEIKFPNIDELKEQINKDIEECLKS